jgi:hypothetical protein
MLNKHIFIAILCMNAMLYSNIEKETFQLQEKIKIDTEDIRLNEIGLFEITNFTVDLDGSIYILCNKSKENTIFKFSSLGKFNKSFCKKGQGPGEIQLAFNIYTTINGDIFIRDTSSGRILVFDADGALKSERKSPTNIGTLIPLANGAYVGKEANVFASANLFKTSLNFYINGFSNKIQLDLLEYPNMMMSQTKINATYHILSFRTTVNKIYSGYPERGYEIRIFDLSGKQEYKIEKPYKRIPITQDYKKKFFAEAAPILELIKDRIDFPKYLPPFHSFIVDDQGRIFVMTYEQGKQEKEYWYDIFDNDGSFLGRKSLEIFYNSSGLYAKIYKNHLYSITEKESGYKELAVFNMIWK